jgi:hypothetical protein
MGHAQALGQEQLELVAEPSRCCAGRRSRR